MEEKTLIRRRTSSRSLSSSGSHYLRRHIKYNQVISFSFMMTWIQFLGNIPLEMEEVQGRGITAKVGKITRHNNYRKIRDRDETGHSTGLGTLARKMISQPVKTVKAVKAFAKSYFDMRKKNVIGGNLPAHRQANKDATK
ncbi:hypothetical protein QZH41_019385, partial [Actinostola sp. cb2023]